MNAESPETSIFAERETYYTCGVAFAIVLFAIVLVLLEVSGVAR